MKKYYFFIILAFQVSSVGLLFTACSKEGKEKEIITVIPDDEAKPSNTADGFYVINEDWFGHDNGTVNFFETVSSTEYKANYRIYRAVNGDDEQLGVTPPYGAIWGKSIYIVSKQGNRLVAADAETMQKQAVLQDIGGDGRGFAGITENKAYISHSSGIAVLDIPTFSISKQIDGVSGQTGTMCLAEGKVFAVSQRNGIYVIDAASDKIEQILEGTYYTLTRSKDGDIWVAGKNAFMVIDPKTMESFEVTYPDGGSIQSSWGAWNAGSLCASTQNNAIYWVGGGSMFSSGTTIYKYDIDAKICTHLYTLGKSDEGTQLEFYGGALRIDPLSDELILLVKHSGWGVAGAYNWIYKLDNNGREITHFAVKGDNGSGASWSGSADNWDDKYFWFPSMPVFKDTNIPQILLNQVILQPGKSIEINLDEKIVDYDNTLSSMVIEVSQDVSMSVSPEYADIQITLKDHTVTIAAGAESGKAAFTISVMSNGIRVKKSVEIIVAEK